MLEFAGVPFNRGVPNHFVGVNLLIGPCQVPNSKGPISNYVAVSIMLPKDGLRLGKLTTEEFGVGTCSPK